MSHVAALKLRLIDRDVKVTIQGESSTKEQSPAKQLPGAGAVAVAVMGWVALSVNV